MKPGVESASERVSVEEAAAVFRRARETGQLSLLDTAVIFHDLGRLARRISLLQTSFPEPTLHTVAIKSNPLVAVLRRAVELGAGLEAASIEEVHLALAAGCPPRRIVFDSPAKTMNELEFALGQGVHVNADSLDELRRIDAVLASRGGGGSVGLRVNPAVGAGSISSTSVAGSGSRFGVSLEGNGESDVIAAFRAFPWLVALHIHVGSQGCPLPLLVAGAERVWLLREAINRAIGRAQVTILDIGGGVPATYSESDVRFSIPEYAGALRREVPGLFAPGVRLITECGRAIQANCGFAVARVEAVKRVLDTSIAVVHVGADFLLRPTYQGEFWRHECAVLDEQGAPRTTGLEPWSLAGPLCFSGDFFARQLALPTIFPGDHVLIRDVGAYTLGLWSRHCSRAMPLVLGYDGVDAEGLRFVTLRRRETVEDLVRFWSP